MNNIVFYNIMRKIDKKIEADIEDSVKRVKNDYKCIGERCAIYVQCCTKMAGNLLMTNSLRKEMVKRSKKRDVCEWDMRGEWWKDMR